MSLKRFVVACLLFVLSACALPSTASALKFEPAAGSPLTGPTYPGETVSGDLNDDGFDDVVAGATGEVGGAGAGLYVWLGNAAGTFSAAPGSPVLAGSSVYALDIGQVNPDTDSDLDLIVFTGGTDFATLFGNGDGTFVNGGTTDIGTQPYGGAQLGDLNDDGVLDLAVTGYPNRISAAINDGEGVFTVSPQQLVTGATELDSIAIGDYDGDGYGDLAMSNFGGGEAVEKWAVYAMKGDGDGTFTEVAGNPFHTASDRIARSVVTLDLNGDVRDDLAVSTQAWPSGQDEIQTLLGDSTSFFVPNPGEIVPTGETPFNIFGGDIDGDGFDDDPAASSFGGGTVAIGLGDHEGGLVAAPGSPFSVGTPPPGLRYFPQGGTIGDFNGDGAPDFAVGSAAGGTGVLMGVAVLLAESDLVWPDGPVEFGDLTIDPTEPAQESVTLRNDGTLAVGLESVGVVGPDADQFEVAEPPAGCFSLGYQEECDLQVEFEPTSEGPKNATLELTTDESEDPVEIALTGTGVEAPAPAARIDPGSISFPEQAVGSTSQVRDVTITSTGNVPIDLKAAAKTEPDASEFTVDGAGCVGTVLPVGESCVVKVAFAPASAGAKTATLTIMAAPEAQNLVVRLTGTGASPVPPPPDPPVLTTGGKLSLKAPKKVKRGKKLKVTASVKNTGTAALTNVVLATKVPGKLAKAPKKIKIASIPVGETVKKTITVAVKKKAGKGKKLTMKVTATAAGTKLSAAKAAARVK